MTDFYSKLIEKSGFDEALISHALDFAKRINISEFSHLFFDTEPFSVENTGVLFLEEAFYPYCFYEKLKALDLPAEKASLYIYISLLEHAFEDFSTRIAVSDIFFDTVKKLSESANNYYKDNDKHGLYDYHFLANHVRGNILRLSGFEYQHGEYDGKRAIILHIPDGADLSTENRIYSYRLARQYFGKFPIIAESWLLYPENKKILSEDSRIVDFMNDFNIVSVSETFDYNELFHIFGRLPDYSYENLPQNTSLQKAYAKRVKRGLPVGSGVGVLKF